MHFSHHLHLSVPKVAFECAVRDATGAWDIQPLGLKGRRIAGGIPSKREFDLAIC